MFGINVLNILSTLNPKPNLLIVKKLLVVFSFLLLLLSCKKDPPIPSISFCEEFPDECVDVREVKDYFYFNYGSWWVYEEENSGLRDSVYITETFTDKSSVLFETWFYSTYDGYFYIYFTTGVRPEVKNNMAKKSEKLTTVYRSKGKPGDYVAEGECFMFYPVPGLWTYSYGGGYIGFDNILEIEDVFADYMVIEENFQKVVKVTEEHTAIEESQPTVHYYCPNVGLIKKELLDSNQVWNLVDYRIFQ